MEKRDSCCCVVVFHLLLRGGGARERGGEEGPNAAGHSVAQLREATDEAGRNLVRAVERRVAGTLNGVRDDAGMDGRRVRSVARHPAVKSRDHFGEETMK